MSQVNTTVAQPVAEPEGNRIKPLKAYAILVSYTLVLFVIGIMIGKLFFWGNYNKQPLADRQISANQQKLKVNPKDPKALTDLGWAYFQKNDYNQALAYYKQALDQDKNYYPAHLNLGLAYMQVKKYDLAVESFKTAISISPKAATAHVNLGLAYNQLQKYADAVKELDLANKANPGSVEVMYELGFAYEKLEKYEDAATQYTAALKFNPKYTKAQEALARIKDKVNK